MKRKYLSALLMGALTVTSVSTFTSCKDYDSDISNLQGQIDKAALSTDVQSLKTQVETAASNASTAATSAEDAMKKAIAANDAVNGVVSSIGDIQGDLDELADAINTNADAAATLIDSLANAGKTQDGKIADIETEITKLQTANKAAADSAASALAKNKQLSEDLENAIKQWGQSKDGYYTAAQIDAKLDSLKDAIAQASDDSIASLKTVVNGYKTGINALYTAVTGVSLVINGFEFDDIHQSSAWVYSPELEFKTGNVQKDLVFGAGEIDDTDAKNKYTADPQKTYKKGDFINFPTSILVRVNPVNAKLTPSMIKLVDSKGNNLDDLLEITDVKAYDGIITSTRSTGTGLWVVSLQLKDGVKAENVAQKASNGKNICYAVAVNNTTAQAETADDAANRYVVSEYGVTVKGTKAYTPQQTLSSVLVAPESKSANDDEWKQIYTLKPDGSNVLYVSNGENILVDFSMLPDAERYYVVLDKGHAGESDASELNAWTHYEYSGTSYNKVVAVADGNSTVNVKINGQVGDEVQFRIFAVNYDGTYVEEGGRAFRVYVGNDASQSSVTGTLKANGDNYMTTGWLAIDGALKDANNGNNSTLKRTGGHVTMTTTDGKVIDVHYDLSKDGETVAANEDKLSECKYIKFWLNNNEQSQEWSTYTTDKLTAGKGLQLWPDDTEATGTLHEDWTGVTYVNNISVKLTKQMPTSADAKSLVGYKWKDKQLVNGVYTAYLYPAGDAWTSSGVDNGYKNMDQAITKLTTNCSIEIENAAKEEGADGNDYYTAVLSATGDNWKLTVDNTADHAGTKLIDGTTQHKSYIKYNYGPISSADVTKDYVVTMEEYNTVFACPLSATAQTYSWGQWSKYNEETKVTTTKNVNELTYGDPTTVENVNLMDYIIGHNAFDNTVFGGKLSGLYKGFGASEGKYTLATVKLISNESKNEDYFIARINGNVISFEKKSETTNPSVDVPSTLVLELNDAFGHEMKYELPFTVKRAQ